jgi:hypothetical protein
MKFKLLFALLTLLSSLSLRSAEHVSIFSSNAIWRLFEGRTEASSPIEAWRTNGFDDSAFVSAFAPFFYGESYPFGTLLAGPSEYTSIFLRKTFEITNVSEIAQLRLHFRFDDGFVVWVNGDEVLRVSVPGNPGFPGFPGDPVTYTTLASTTNEATAFFTLDLPNALSVLVPGSNVIAVQVFNVSTNFTDDMVFDAALEAILVDTNPPVIVGVAPAPGPVQNLSQITVQFSELVFGVTANDLLINSNAATSVTGSNNLYTFTFIPPPSGPVHISWSSLNGISDEANLPFDGSAPGAQWDYINTDTTPPTVIDLNPAPGSLVYLLQDVRVAFSEAVRGVDASDLLLNGQTAFNVITQSPSAYVFQFTPPRPGSVQMAWADGHGITDLAPVANAFGGGSWNYTANRAPYSILLNPNTNTVLVTFSNKFFIGICTVEGRDNARGARWVPLVNFYTTQKVGQVTVPLPTNYPNLRLVCMQIAPGNAQVRLPIAYGNIHTVAGIPGAVSYTNAWRPEYEGANATEVVLSDPRYAVADSAENIYVLERAGHAISKITPDGKIHTFIGRHVAGFDIAQDAGALGTNVLLNTPSGLCLAGNRLYVLDAGNSRIRVTDLSSPFAFTALQFTDPIGIGTNASGLGIVLDNGGLAEEAFYGVGNQVRRLPLDEPTDSPIITSNFYKIGNITINPEGDTIVTDPVEGRVYRVRGNGSKVHLAGRGFSSRRVLGGEVENVPLPGASSVWYLPIAFISNNLDPTYFISLDQGARVWYVDADNDNATPFIFGEPGAHAGDGEWFRKGGAKPKVSNVLSVTMSPAGHIILVEGNGIVRQIDFVRSRP